jgi:hypothetical protein
VQLDGKVGRIRNTDLYITEEEIGKKQESETLYKKVSGVVVVSKPLVVKLELAR